MKKYILLFILLVAQTSVFSQTFSGTGGSIFTIVDTSRFNINVNGLTPSTINNTFGLEQVEINITHGRDQDVNVYLTAPDGTFIPLTIGNGGTGSNYTNTIFRWDASIGIAQGVIPFNGNYKPQGNLYNVNNGQNGNGMWQLRVIDVASGFSGSVTSWSLTFGNHPAHIFSFFDSSLPILVMNTDSQTIGSTEIICDLGIINNGIGVRNHLTDPFTDFNSKIKIKWHGSSTLQFPKKPYAFSTLDSAGVNEVNVSIVGLPADNDWILKASYTDKSFMHDVLIFQLANEMGEYAPRTRYIDVVINGSYQGVYQLMENIKQGHSRVNISKMHPTDTAGVNLTGGYIFRIDKGNGPGWTSLYAPVNHPNGQTILFQYDYPKIDSMPPVQQNYIHSYTDSFENALAGGNFMDTLSGWRNFAGAKSFIDYFFCDEITKDVDGYRISTYLNKDKDKKIKAGPIWDYDIAFGNANYCSGYDTTGWAYQFPCTGDGFQIPFWWNRLLQDSTFRDEEKCRWTQLRQNVLSQSNIYSIIDSCIVIDSESVNWNFQIWPILGIYVWPNVAPYPTTYAGEIANLKRWVATRLTWLDANLPGNCNCNLTVSSQNASCSNNCDGQAIASGASAYPVFYNWDNGAQSDTITSLCAGTYILTMADAVGCMQTDTVNIGASLIFTATTTSTQSNCGQCNGTATAHTSGGTGNFSYQWNNGLTTDSIFNLCSGNYSVTITDSGGCAVLRNVLVAGSSSVATTYSSSNVLCNGTCTGTSSVNVTSGTAPFTYQWQPGGYTTSSVNNICANIYTVTITDSNGCAKTDTIIITQPTVLNAVASTSTDVSCNGGNNGSASVTTSGGIPPYVFVWNPSVGNTASVSNLTAGTYTVSVSDSNLCVDTAVFIIGEPSSLTVFTSSTPSSCGSSNGTATCAPSGGTAPYTYAWSPIGGTASTATNLSAGNYSVAVIDAHNCIQTSSVSVNNSNAPIITLASSIDEPCNGDSIGSASTNITGGTSPFTYSWSPVGGTGASATNLHAGNYIVTVTDANMCISTLNISITEPPAIAINLSSTNVTCFGSCDGTANTNVIGGTSGYTYLWCNNSTASSITGLCGGNCSVQITDAHNCIATQSFNIPSPGSAIGVTIAHTDASCTGCTNGWASAIVNGGNSPYTYLWNTVPPQSTSLAVNLLPGTYVVCITDANACTVCDTVEVLDASVGINEMPKQSSPMYVYPNPASNSASFIFSLSKKQRVMLQVFDARGKLVRELVNEVRNSGDHILTMGVSDLSEGIYQYEFCTEERVQNGSIVIHR